MDARAVKEECARRLFAPVVVVCGHYGAGKTNFALNLAHDAAACGMHVTLIDLDVVNPYFRSSDYARDLESWGIEVISPVFASRGTSLDVPSLTGAIAPAIEQARAAAHTVVIDAGGDDVGATALGRFANVISSAPYEMLYVVNERRNLTQTAREACEVLREIEKASGLRATAVANNTHLQKETDLSVIEGGIAFAKQVARMAELPLACTTVPEGMWNAFFGRKDASLCQKVAPDSLYPVRIYVRTPWDMLDEGYERS